MFRKALLWAGLIHEFEDTAVGALNLALVVIVGACLIFAAVLGYPAYQQNESTLFRGIDRHR